MASPGTCVHSSAGTHVPEGSVCVVDSHLRNVLSSFMTQSFSYWGGGVCLNMRGILHVQENPIAKL